ncbi:hypothetical protein [Vibrio algicola]|uniref:hypothetical protein n=1 Tax=Vibrio algicola TaxID=2662262 RepID=UPI0015B6762C|nr:hypothetical protein [Vibrio algicola]
MFSLPMLQLDLDKSLLARVRKLHPAKYEKVIETSTGFSRFYSNVATFNVCDFAMQEIDLPNNCLFIHPIDDMWYVLLIDNGEVRAQKMLSLSDIVLTMGYEIESVEYIYCPQIQNLLDYLTHYNNKIVFINPLDLSLLTDEYCIPISKTHNPMKIGLCVLFLAVLISAIYGAFFHHSEHKTVVHIDPLAAYKQHVFSSIVASDAFKVAYKASVYGFLLPNDWVFSNIRLSHNTMQLNYEDSPNGSMNKTMTAFTKIHPAIEHAWNEASLNFGWTMESPTSLQITTLPKNIYFLRDALINLGFTVVQMNKPSVDGVEIMQLTITRSNTNFTTLNTLATLTSALPIYMSTLEIQRGLSIPNINIKSVITLEGERNDR